MDGISTRTVLDDLAAEGFRVTAVYRTRERVIPPPAKVRGALVWGLAPWPGFVPFFIEGAMDRSSCVKASAGGK